MLSLFLFYETKNSNNKLIKHFVIDEVKTNLCKQKTPCIVEMPSDDDEVTATATHEAVASSDYTAPMSEEDLAEYEQKKDGVDKISHENTLASNGVNSRKMIVLSDEGVCCLLFELI